MKLNLQNIFYLIGQLFAAGRLEQDGPYDGPDWGMCKYQ